jgi:hypothetical protein
MAPVGCCLGGRRAGARLRCQPARPPAPPTVEHGGLLDITDRARVHDVAHHKALDGLVLFGGGARQSERAPGDALRSRSSRHARAAAPSWAVHQRGERCTPRLMKTVAPPARTPASEMAHAPRCWGAAQRSVARRPRTFGTITPEASQRTRLTCVGTNIMEHFSPLVQPARPPHASALRHWLPARGPPSGPQAALPRSHSFARSHVAATVLVAPPIAPLLGHFRRSRAAGQRCARASGAEQHLCLP